MENFYYEVIDKSGQSSQGVLQENSEEQVVQYLKSQGYYIVKVSKRDAFFKKIHLLKQSINLTSFFFRIVPIQELRNFFQQGHLLLSSGVRLTFSLNLLAQQSRNVRFKAILVDFSSQLDQGKKLSESMKGYPDVFSSLYISMVETGEMSGHLAEVFERISLFLERKIWLNSKIMEALIYPTFILILTFSIVFVIMFFVLPRFESVFLELGVSLPWSTLFLLKMSHFLIQYALYCVGGIVAFFVLLKNSLRWQGMKDFLSRMALNLPLISDIYKNSLTVHVASTLGTLLKNGVGLSESLLHIQQNLTNKFLKKKMGQILMDVRDGVSLSVALSKQKIFPLMALNMVMVSEETGTMDDSLEKVAEIYEEKLNQMLSKLMKTLEPLLILVMSLIVGGIVISLFLPLISVMDASHF